MTGKISLLLILLMTLLNDTEAQVSWGIRSFTNTNDLTIGLKVGSQKESSLLESYVLFDIRPFEKRVLVSDARAVTLQLREQRYFAGAGFEYHIGRESPQGLFFMMNLAYTWANYFGTAIKPDKSIIVIPGVGGYLQLSEVTKLKIGYAYFDSQSLDVENSKIYISITGLVN